VSLNIRDFKLDLTYRLLENKVGSKVVMKDATLKRDSIGKYFEYKYYLNLSQTDCRMSLQVFSSTGKTGKMLLQYSISAFEVESTELQDEQWFAEQLSQTQSARKISEQSGAGGHITTRARKSLRVRDINSLSSRRVFRLTPRNERESLPTQDLSVGLTAEEDLHQPRQTANISSPVFSNAEAISVDSGVLQENPPRANSDVTDDESEIWNTAIAAMGWLTRPNQEEGNPYMSKGHDTPNLGRAKRAASACKSIPSPAYVIPSPPNLHTIGTSQDFGVPSDDPSDPDYYVSQYFNPQLTIAYGTNVT
jgi:hypothetical protein